MIVKVKTGHNSYDEWRQFLYIDVDDELAVSFYDGEPEDNNLCRNFGDCYGIPDLMQRAYDAGLRGEKFEVVEVEATDEDIF